MIVEMKKSKHNRLLVKRLLKLHPEIIDHIIFYSINLLDAGVTHWGIGAIYEVMRYNTALNSRAVDDSFKLNNDFRAELARRAMKKEPRLVDFFETRRLRSADRIVKVDMDTLKEVR